MRRRERKVRVRKRGRRRWRMRRRRQMKCGEGVLGVGKRRGKRNSGRKKTGEEMERWRRMGRERGRKTVGAKEVDRRERRDIGGENGRRENR